MPIPVSGRNKRALVPRQMREKYQYTCEKKKKITQEKGFWIYIVHLINTARSLFCIISRPLKIGTGNGNCTGSKCLAIFSPYQIVYLSRMTATCW